MSSSPRHQPRDELFVFCYCYFFLTTRIRVDSKRMRVKSPRTAAHNPTVLRTQIFTVRNHDHDLFSVHKKCWFEL
jgi:hypothetical protein